MKLKTIKKIARILYRMVLKSGNLKTARMLHKEAKKAGLNLDKKNKVYANHFYHFGYPVSSCKCDFNPKIRK